jgi:hypothetical protein
MGPFLRSVTVVMASVLLLMSGCSSGGSSQGTSHAVVSGVAATGSAISGTIYLRDAHGNELSVSTSDGSYSFDVTGLTAPFILRAAWSEGGEPMELYSLAISSGTANISPLTHAIVSQAAGGDIAGVYDDPTPSALASLAENLPAALSGFRSTFGPLLLEYVSSANVNPISDTFTADHQGLDKLLDDTSFAFTPDATTITDRVSGKLLYESPASHLDQGVSFLSWEGLGGTVVEEPSIAVDSGGNALVLWSQNAGAGVQRNDIESKWLSGDGNASRVSDGIASCVVPKVAFTPDGVAHAVWYQGTDAGLSTVWSARYVPGTGWTGLTQVSANTTGWAMYPDIAVDGSGNAVAVWYQGVSRLDVYASRYSAQAGTWTEPTMINDASYSAFLPKVGMNAAGKAVVAWVQAPVEGSSPHATEVAAATFNGLAWSSPVRINSIDDSDLNIYGQAEVAVDSNGNALAVWCQGYIQAASLVNDAWSASSPISTGAANNNYGPEVAFVSPGKAVALWEKQEAGTAYIEANVFDSTGGWDSSTTMSQGSELVSYPHLAAGSDGVAAAVWMETTGHTTTLMNAGYSTSSGWASPDLVETLSVDITMIMCGPEPVAAVGSNGQDETFMVWGLIPN